MNFVIQTWAFIIISNIYYAVDKHLPALIFTILAGVILILDISFTYNTNKVKK